VCGVCGGCEWVYVCMMLGENVCMMDVCAVCVCG